MTLVVESLFSLQITILTPCSSSSLVAVPVVTQDLNKVKETNSNPNQNPTPTKIRGVPRCTLTLYPHYLPTVRRCQHPSHISVFGLRNYDSRRIRGLSISFFYIYVCRKDLWSISISDGRFSSRSGVSFKVNQAVKENSLEIL